MTSLIPASAASRIASAAKAAGTNMTLVSAPVSLTAIMYCVEDGHIKVLGSAFLWSDTANNVGSVINALFRVEAALHVRSFPVHTNRVSFVTMMLI